MSADFLFLWMMALVRAGGLMALIPAFSGQSIPMQVRLAIAAVLAYVACSFMHATAVFPADVPALILAAAHEALIGLLMGFVARLILYAVEFAGQLMSTELGLTMSTAIDPISHNNSSALGIALFYFGSLLFLISGAHHAVFAAFLRSFELAPPGGLGLSRNVAELFVSSTGNIFLVALQMAAPLMAVNFVVTFTFALLGKASPSINVFAESASVRIVAGLTILGLTLGLTAQLVLRQLSDSPELMLRLIP